jgi:hypothetical protein
MRKNYAFAIVMLFAIILFAIPKKSFGQCTNCGSQYPSGTASTTSASWILLGSAVYGGDWSEYSLDANYIYQWTTSGTSGSTYSGVYDPYLTLFPSGTCGATSAWHPGPYWLGYDDDYTATMSYNALLAFSPTYNRGVRILNTQSSCSTNSSNGYLYWRAVPKTPTISGGGVTICNGSSATLTAGNLSVNDASVDLQWGTTSGGTNISADAVSVSVAPTVTTTYYLRYVVYGGGSLGTQYSNVASTTVYVDQPTVAGTVTQTPGSGGTVCSGGNVNYSYSGGLGAFQFFEYQWNATGGSYSGSWMAGNPSNWTSGLNGASVLYVRASAKNGVCPAAASAPVNITVQSVANDPGAVSLPASICQGTATNITNVTPATTGTPASAGPTYYYYWSRTSAPATGYANYATSAASSYALPTDVINTPGTYIIARNSAFACTGQANNASTVNIPITVHASPTDPTSITNTGTTICYGSPITLTAAGGSEGSGCTYQWYSGACGTGTLLAGSGSSISVSPTTTTTYYVRRVGNTSCTNTTGCASGVVTVEQTPVAPTLSSQSPVNGSTICPGYNSGTATFAGGSGGAANYYEYSINGGSNWTSYTNASAITTSGGTTSVQVRGRRNGSVCTASGYNTYTLWSYAGTPTSPTLGAASPASGTVICAGFNTGSVTGTGGSGGSTNAANEYQFSINGGGNWNAYISGAAIITTGATGNVIVQSRRTGGDYGCNASAWSTICTWTLGTATTAPTLGAASPANGSTICAGYNIGTVTGTGGSGGSTNAANEYQYSIDGGGNWTAYTNGAAIVTAGASGSVIVQSRRTAGGYGCSTTAWSTICSWTVASTPTSPTLSAASPINGSTICQGFNIGSVTGTGGSGGSTNAANEYQYSINGGGNWNTYTNGAAITTSAATGSVIVQSRRTAGDYGCSASAWSTLCTWTIGSTPTSPTLGTASPASGSIICAGYNIGTVTGTGGSGGSTNAVNEYQYSINGGGNWNTYTNGAAITTSAATGSVIVQSRRSGGDYGCNASAWSTISSWTIGTAPTAPTLSAASPVSGSVICGGYNIGTVTGTGGSGGSTNAANVYQVSIDNGSIWSTYTSGTSISTDGASGSVIVQSQRTAGDYGCSTTGWSTLSTWTVGSTPIAPTLSAASPVSGTTVCVGFNIGTVTGTGGSGGSSTAANEYQYSINGGGNWNTYTNGAAIPTGAATGSIIVQSHRTAGSYGCSTTAWSTLCTWPLGTTPTAPTLSSASPANGTTICAGYNIGTVTGTGGSGGSSNAANEYRVSINGGGSYSPYTNGAAISTDGASGSVIVQSHRTGGDYGCSASGWSTICSWTVGSTPTAPTLGSASPDNGSSICAGYDVGTVTGTGGSGGSTGAVNSYRVSIDGGSTYSDYSSGDAIISSAATGNIIVQSQRTGGSYGCTESLWSTISEWILSTNPVAPTLSAASPASGTLICAGFNIGTVTGTGGSAGSTNAANEYELSINGGTNYSTYVNGSSISTDGATGSVIVRTRRTAGDYGCSTSGWSTLCTWTVGSTPISPTVNTATPANATTICAGYNVGTVTVNVGSGGSADAVDVYQYSINGGSSYSTYVPGAAISTDGGTGSVIVRAQHTGGSYGCSASSWRTLNSWTFGTTPTAPTLGSASPANGSSICAGYDIGTVTGTGGSGGSTGAINKYRVSIDGGSIYSDYTSGDAISTSSATGNIVVQSQRTGGNYGCTESSWTTICEWVLSTNPIAPTLSEASPASGTLICAGFNTGTVTGTGGSAGSTNAANVYELSIDGGANYDTYLNGDLISTDGASGSVIVRTRRTAGDYGCSTSGWSTLCSWTVGDSPVAPTLSAASPIDGTTICAGYNAGAVTINAGSGGSADAVDVYQYSINGGSNYSTYIPGAAIITTGGTGSVIVRAQHTGGSYGCSSTAWNILSTWTIGSTPQAPTLNIASPISGTSICLGYNSGSVTAIAGSGGSTGASDEYDYSINGGSSRLPYSIGSAINTSTASSSVIIRSKRTSGDYGCATTVWSTLCTWNIASSPIAPVLSSASPTNGSTICLGYNLGTVTASGGSGGSTGSSNEYQYSINSGTDYSSYTSGSAINTDAANESVIVQSRRTSGNYGCSNTAWNTITSWSVAPVPIAPTLNTATPSNGTTICSGANPSATFNAGSEGSECTDSFQYSINGVNWFPYIQGSTTITSGPTGSTVIIQGKRGCLATGCDAVDTYVTLVSWPVVSDPSISNAVFTNTLVCTGGSTQVSSTLSAGTGDPQLQWKYLNGGTWENVTTGHPVGASYSDANTQTLTISGVSVAGTYRYKLTSTPTGFGCDNTEGLSATFEVVNQPDVSVNGANITVCTGATLIYTASVSGGAGAGSYKWQSSANNSTWSDFGTETSSALTVPTGFVGDTYYRAAYKTANSGCDWQYTASRRVTVVTQPSISDPIYTNNITCPGGSTDISSSLSDGTGTIAYIWQYYNGSTWSNVTAGVPTGATYLNQTTTLMTISGITALGSHQYRLKATLSGSGCSTALSNGVSYTVVAQPSLSDPSFSITPICSQGSTEVSSNLLNGTGTPSYQWQYYSGSAWINVTDGLPAGAVYSNQLTNTMTIAGVSAANTYQYKLLLLSMDGSGCNANQSAAKSFTVVNDPSLSIATFTIPIICAGGTTVVNSTLSNGTGTTSYQWKYYNGSSWVDVSAGTPTGATYTGATTASLSIAGTTEIGVHQYKLIVGMNGEGCTSTESVPASFTVVANPVTQSITEVPTSGSTICIGASTSATFSGGSGGTGTITNSYEYSTNAGSSWLSYTPSSSVTSVSTGVDQVRIRTRRLATGEGCVTSDYNMVKWTVVADPSLSVVSVSNSTICAGGSTIVNSTLSGGTGTPTYTWQFWAGSTWESVSNGTPVGATYSGQTSNTMTIAGTTVIGTHRYRLQVTMDGLDCNTATSEGTFTVVANPSLSALSYTNPSICVGGTTTVSSTLTNGVGTPTYTWQYYNGSIWGTVANGTPAGSVYTNQSTNALTITGATAIGNHQYRLNVSMSGNGCSAAQTAGVTYQVTADPVAQTISESPIEGTIICAGGLVSAGFNGGSGGTETIVNHYQYSINGGTLWTDYTPGNDIAATGVGTNMMKIKSWRTATGNGCDNSLVNTAQWTIVANPLPPSATKVPNTETVCQNQLLFIENPIDNGGGTGSCEIQYQYTSNSGVTWSAWGTSIPAFSSVIDESNRIQARKQCDGYGCVAEIATFTWDAIVEMELTNPTFINPVICAAGSTIITTSIIGSAGQDHPQWQYLNPVTLLWANVANGTPTGAVYTNTNSLNMTISGISNPGLYYYRAVLNIPNSGCEETQSDAGTLRVIEQPSAPTFAVKSPNYSNVCAGATLTLSGPASGGDNSGVTCSYEYRYFNGSMSTTSTSLPSFTAVIGSNYIQARRVNCLTGCNASDWNTVATWTVNEQAQVSIVNIDQVACKNDQLIYSVQISGGTGVHNYQWQSSPDSTTWSNIASQTNASITIPTNTSGTFYYRIKYQPSGVGCNAVYDTKALTIRNYPSITGIQANDYVWIGNIDNNWFIAGNWRKYNGSSYSVPVTAPNSNNNIYIMDENSCVNRKIINVSNIEAEFKNIFIDQGFELKLVD